MSVQLQADRRRIAKKIAAAKLNIAQHVSQAFFLDHPDWLARFGERGRQFCTEDTRFHLDFLCGALEAGSPESFADYAAWTTRMLAARNLAADSLKENFERIAQMLSSLLEPEELSEAKLFLASGEKRSPEIGTETATTIASAVWREMGEVFLFAILNGQRQAAVNIVEEGLRAGYSHVDIYADLFSEALHRVGRLWEMNKITVAQEHLATGITQYAIARIYPTLAPSGPRRGKMIVTGVAGELHQIGANLVADSMEAKGWQVHFLGSNMPPNSILHSIRENSADVVCISTTLVANLPAAAELVRSVRCDLGDHAPRFVTGGSAFRLAGNFVDEDNFGRQPVDLRAALKLLCP